MDLTGYGLEQCVASRLDEARAYAARAAEVARYGTPRPDVRAVLGRALIRAGRWLARGPQPSPRPA